MTQEAVVFAIVALAAAYAAWRLMPRVLRGRLAHAMAGFARRRGRLSDRDAAALARRLTASGCGSCDSCGPCGPEPAAAPNVSVLRQVPRGSGAGRAPHGESPAVTARD